MTARQWLEKEGRWKLQNLSPTLHRPCCANFLRVCHLPFMFCHLSFVSYILYILLYYYIWDRVWSKLILYINLCNVVNIIQSCCTLNKPYTASSPFHSSLHYSCLVPILQTKQVWLHFAVNRAVIHFVLYDPENLSLENCVKSFKLPTITSINSIPQKTSLEP